MYTYIQKSTGRIVTCERPLDWDGYELVTEEKEGTAVVETAVPEKKEPVKKRTVKK